MEFSSWIVVKQNLASFPYYFSRDNKHEDEKMKRDAKLHGQI